MIIIIDLSYIMYDLWMWNKTKLNFMDVGGGGSPTHPLPSPLPLRLKN
jgi:hypothetical protein